MERRVYFRYKMATTAWFAVRVHVGTEVKLNEFLQHNNEETVGDFISGIIENRAELKNLSVQEIKATDITCSIDMPMGVLLQRSLFDLDIRMARDIQGKTTNPENCFTYMMKMANSEDILPKPRLGSLLYLYIKIIEVDVANMELS